MGIRNLGIATFSFSALLPMVCFGQNKKPNVLIIMTDQQRWDAMRCAGNLEIKTPNMDRIAREGVQFMNAYSACPVSVPARSTILTGRTIFNTKVLGNNDIESDSIPNIPTFDQVLSANGYHTEYYGKWHVPYQFASKYNNVVRTTNKSKHTSVQTNVEGFREYLNEVGVPVRKPNENELIDNMSLRPYTPLPVDGRWDMQSKSEDDNAKGIQNKSTDTRNSQQNNFGLFQTKGDASLAAFEGYEALVALKAMKPNTPFSLTCSFGPPHPPFIVPKQYADLYNMETLSVPLSISDDLANAPYTRSNQPLDARFQKPEMVKQMKWVYYAMVTQVDEWVGKLLDELDKKGIANNTIVLFVSDHGEMLGDHGLVSKMKMYEGSVHIPMMIRYPGVIPAGKKVESPVSHHDIFATLLDYTGMKIPENDGRSLRKLIDGKKDVVDYAVSVWGAITNGGPFMIRKGDWKMIVYLQMTAKKPKNVHALYNLKNDPLETNNLIGTNPEKAKSLITAEALKQCLKSWMIKTKTPYIKELENVIF
ncbi:MAG: sulfatase-like hydrolase/transferase [Bacteroidia bacterium]|nr:sulfatase-like hydrolase/transferase [Bacteroidia bacterium]